MTNYIHLLDESRYFTAQGIPHRRQKVIDNLLGDRRFCPVILKTDILKNYLDLQLDQKGIDIVERYPEEILRRAVSYLYTKETKSSFEIERTAPDQKRAARFVESLNWHAKINWHFYLKPLEPRNSSTRAIHHLGTG